MGYLQKRGAAFKYAFKGVYWLFIHESHAKIHLCAAVCVIFAGFIFHISSSEWCVICLCIGLVFTAEGVNTAIEKLADKISKEKDPLIGIAKDVAAGSVLLAVLSALAIASIIFIPKL